MIEVTQSYLGLDKNTKKCQNAMSFDNCTTNYYLDTIRKKCQCLPFTINSLKEVDKKINISLIFSLEWMRLSFNIRLLFALPDWRWNAAQKFSASMICLKSEMSKVLS